MKVLGVLFIASCASGIFSNGFSIQPEFVLNIGEKRDEIVRIFENISTLSVLLRNYEQPEGIIQSLDNIFGFGVQSFVIFNFFDEESYTDWITQCKIFLINSTTRTAYYERFFMKSHKPDYRRKTLDFLEDLEPVNIQQSPANSNFPASDEAIQEKFADSLDRWFSFRKFGYILLSSLHELKHYLGCLLNRSGTFLLIIENELETLNSTSFSEVTEMLGKAWNYATNMKIYVLIVGEIFVFNPFALNIKSNQFGVLEKLENGVFKRDFRNLNGYPLNVDLFASAYSVIETLLILLYGKSFNYLCRFPSFGGLTLPTNWTPFMVPM